MSFCPYCGGPVDAGAAKCTYCGSPLPQQAQAPAPQANAGYTSNASAQRPNQSHSASEPVFSGASTSSSPSGDSIFNNSARNQPGSSAKSDGMSDALMDILFQMFDGGDFEEDEDDEDISTASSNNIDRRTPGRKEFSADIFSNTNWKSEWNGMCDGTCRTGIILTDTTGVQNLKSFYASLEAYIEHKKERGIHYALLDIKTQCLSDIDNTDISDVICMLGEVYCEAVPHFLMIVGDSSVIPSARWRNPIYDPSGEGDSDKYVTSDLPYYTFDTESPWDGMEYYFENITQVGRVPTSAATGFKEAETYFRNARFAMLHDSPKSFAYSAKQWERTSKVEFASVKPYMITSPDYTSSPAYAKKYDLKLLGPVNPDYNLLCFNLHGSLDDNSWYGQNGAFYPEGFKASLLPQQAKSYALITEACYGAKPNIDPDDSDKSILLTALASNCIAFVGSTQIAYGCDDGRLSGADIIADAYLKSVAKGKAFGESFLDALTAINSYDMDEVDIKTLAEFALYGDPSGALVNKSATKAFGKQLPKVKAKTKKNSAKKITLLSCDESQSPSAKGIPTLFSFSTEQRMEIQTMSKSIQKTGKDLILSKYSAMSSVEPKIFKVMGRSGYRAHYSKKQGNIVSLVNIHLDDNGKVQKVYVSK